jgi:hypothetical protein
MKSTIVRCALLAFALLALLAGGATAQNPVQDKKTANDLKQIVISYHLYYDANTKAPQKAEDLAPFFENDKRLLELLKSGQIVFIYGVGILEMTDGTSNTVIAYEKDAPTKGGTVAYGDGSVKKLTADEFKKAILAKKK